MYSDSDAPRNPLSGRPNPPRLGLLMGGIFSGVLSPIMMLCVGYNAVTRSDFESYLAVLTTIACLATLFGAIFGIRDLLKYKRRRATFAQETRDYEADLARAVDFNEDVA